MEPRLDKHMGMWGSPAALFLDFLPNACLVPPHPSDLLSVLLLLVLFLGGCFLRILGPLAAK